MSWSGFGPQHRRAGLHVAIAIDDAEGDVESVEPLVVVDAGPMKASAHVGAALDRGVDDVETAPEVARADLVIVGADPELGNQEGRAGNFGMQAVDDQPHSVGPYPVSERRN